MPSSCTCVTSRPKVRKSRIKCLRGLDRPQYRLRVNEVRVFDDLTETTVEVLAIVTKEQAKRWLAEEATPTPEGGPGEGQEWDWQVSFGTESRRLLIRGVERT